MRFFILLLAVGCCLWSCRGPAFCQTSVWRYGYIDTQGELVIKPQFVFARDFSEGIAWVQFPAGVVSQSARVDAIDLKGRLLFSLDGNIQVNQFKGGVAEVFAPGYTYVDRSGKTVAYKEPAKKAEEPKIQPFGEVVREGERLIFRPGNGSSDHQRWGHFCEGLCHISYTLPGSYDVHEGYMDKSNQVVLRLPPTIKDCGEFHDDLAPVEIRVPESKLNDMHRMGFIDRSGALVIPPIYELPNARDMSSAPLDKVQFHDHVALVRRNGECCYVDRKGKCIAHFRGDCAEFSDGLAAVAVLVDAHAK